MVCSAKSYVGYISSVQVSQRFGMEESVEDLIVAKDYTG